jgi:hypothetical protein
VTPYFSRQAAIDETAKRVMELAGIASDKYRDHYPANDEEWRNFVYRNQVTIGCLYSPILEKHIRWSCPCDKCKHTNHMQGALGAE